MADCSLILCDVLCFNASKYGKTKELNNTVSDFHSTESLSTAKLRLAEDIDKLDLSTKRPHVPARRDGDGRLIGEIDYIMDKIPTYVVDSQY